jgi:Domain of unknown function (DUF4268)
VPKAVCEHTQQGAAFIRSPRRRQRAITIIWIAARFTEEHRSTLDWLNKITDARFRFFGLEVELWRIGSFQAAPKFNIVSKPNDWSQSVAQAARAIDETELSDTRLMQRNYWAALNTVLDASAGPVAGNKKPQPQSWMSYPVGRTGFTVGVGMVIAKKLVRVELYISGNSAKAFFGLLERQKDAIERDLGYPLLWEELPEGQDCRISCILNEADPTDDSDWPRQQEWLAKRLNDMHRVFARRIRTLDPEDWRSEHD